MRPTTLLLASSLLGASCVAPQAPPPPDPAGDGPSRVLQGWGEERALGWRVERLFVLGGDRDFAGIPVNIHPKDIAVDPHNRVFLLDRVARRLLVYSALGEFTAVMGRAGRGPGELAAPGGIAISESGELWVWDTGKGALVGFDGDGTVLPERPITSSGSVLSFRVFRADTLLAFEARQDTLVLSEHADGYRKPLGTFVRDSARMLDSGACPFSDIPLRPLFGATLLWDARADTVAMNAGGGALIRITARNWQELVLQRFLAPRRVTRALAERSLRAGLLAVAAGNETPCRVPPRDILESAGTALVFPAYSDLVLVPDGLLWAVRYRAPDETRYQADIFSLRTGYLGTLSLGAARPVAARPDGTLIFLESAPGARPILTIHRVDRPE